MTEGEQLRDEGIARALKAEREAWKRRYRMMVSVWFAGLRPGDTFTGEQFRMAAEARGLGPPHHANVWGGAAAGFVRRFLRAGVIAPAGTEAAFAAKAHARRYPLYRKIGDIG